LSDGTVFRGVAFGAVGKGIVSRAEVVFNTAVSGYQESLTDPSYTGQILVQTFPLIGNTGTNPEDVESPKVQVAGLAVRELARRHSNYRADSDLSAYLARYGVLGIEGIDTRALTRKLRSGGSMSGVLSDRADLSDEQLVEMARSAPSMAGQNLVPMVGCSQSRSWGEPLGDWKPAATETGSRRYRVIALDCGAKSNILRNLTERGCDVTLVPHDVSDAEIRRQYAAGEVDGVFISNGPGDPAAVEKTITTLRGLLSPSSPPIPMFGICLGHQLLALAAGAKTYKLKFGHRGINQPILNRESGKVEITSQNHGFAVDARSLEAVGGVPTHIHLNDQTLAGFRMKDRPVFSVQYHPEASPGPHDAGYLFDQFVSAMAAARR
jgi:carbamoyl-phosphate synthase small subunit